jgi:zinc transport system ATP-binding protein
VIHGVDLSVSPGEFVALVGPNGSGKSTLVKAIVGLAEVQSGSVELFGAEGATRRSRVGYVPQRHTAGGPIPSTVEEVVSSGCLADRRWRPLGRTDREATAAALDRLGLAPLARKPVERLSGGQQRRVLIARALVRDVQFLVLDEPTAGLDAEAQAELAEVLDQLSRTGTTILVVTHDTGPFERSLTRIVWISHGRIEYDGPPTEAILRATGEPFAHHDDDPSPPERRLMDD